MFKEERDEALFEWTMLGNVDEGEVACRKYRICTSAALLDLTNSSNRRDRCNL